jgi:prepilin-type N-terminal cleavage/methylation domain-containing protein
MKGFTLIEVLITVVVLVVLATAGIMYLADYYFRQNLELTVEEITALIRDAQNRSLSQQDGQQWGIRFENATQDSVKIFYATSTFTSIYVLRAGVRFSNPSEGNYKDVVFSKLTGYPEASSSVVVALINNPSVSSTISVSVLGRVTPSGL